MIRTAAAAAALATLLSASQAQTPTQEIVTPCVLRVDDAGVWTCIASSGGGGSQSGTPNGGIGSGVGSGGSGTNLEVPTTELNAPSDTKAKLSGTRDSPATLRFDSLKQLQDFKTQGMRVQGGN